MPEKVSFIGREEEIAQINAGIKEETDCLIICIQGKGGIGKTRLIQEVYQQQNSNSLIQQLPLIDFDEQELRYPEMLKRRIAKLLNEENFKAFLTDQADYYKMKKSDVSSIGLKAQSDKIIQSFATGFNKISQKKKIVLYFDTTEHLTSDSEIRQELEIQLLSLKNVVILFAGRNAKEIGASLKEQEGSHKVDIIELHPFSESESCEYLEEKERCAGVRIEDQIRGMLITFSKGRPILLDLAVEMRVQGIPLEMTGGTPVSEENFEKYLLAHLKRFHEPIPDLALMSAYIYPLTLNPQRISKLLRKTMPDSQKLLEKASEYVFVKTLPDGSIMLHDEMRALVNKHAWPEVDPEKDRRRWYSELATECLSHEITELEAEIQQKLDENDERLVNRLQITQIHAREQQLWLLKEEQLRHTLIKAIDEGITFFAVLFDEVGETKGFDRRRELFNFVRSYKPKLSLEQQNELDVRESQLLSDEQKYGKALQLCDSLLSLERVVSHELEIKTLILRANIKIRQGTILEGIRDFETAVSLSERKEFLIWHIRALNGLGWALRVLGDLKEAQKRYSEARRLCLAEGGREKKELQSDFGWISNNLAFVLSNEYATRPTAIEIAKATLQHWRSIHNDVGLGACHLVLGIAYYRTDSTDDAFKEFGESLKIFESLKSNDWLGQIYSWRGALHHHLRKPEDAEKDLKKSLAIGTPNIEAMTLNRLGRVYMLQRKWDLAQEYIEKSLKLSKQIPDYLYWLASIARLAIIAAIKKEYWKLSKFKKDFAEYSATIKTPDKSTLGILYLAFAQLSFGEKDKDSIVRYLQEGISLITENGPYSRTDILKRLDNLETSFADSGVQREFVHSVGKKLYDYFNEKAANSIKYEAVIPKLYEWATWEKGTNE